MRHRIAVVGLPFFGARVARSLRGEGFRAKYVPHPGRNALAWPGAIRTLLRADLVYTIGSSSRKWGPADLMAMAGKSIVMHWAGSDVLDGLKDWEAGRISNRVLERAVHWTAAPWLGEELKPLGISPEWRPLPMPIKTGESLPLPSTFRVLVYHGKLPHRAYNIEGMLEVIRALPHIPFVLVGGYQPASVPENLEVVGWVDDMKAQYARTSALLRLVHHDAMSHSVVEALGYGRQVLWNYEVPGVRKVDGAEDAIRELDALHAGRDQLQLNADGIAFAQTFLPERIIPEAAGALRSMLA
jgi:hypothetical protein